MVTASAVPAARSSSGRLAPIDAMRGLVMVLMAIDHSSDAFNGGRLFTDGAFVYTPGMSLPAGQFLTRWITHICAPTFLFLAGTGLAFTVAKMAGRGEKAWAIDRYLLIRGVLIAAFELWISAFVTPHGVYVLQVLYAIGTSFVFMIPLRRLPDRVALVVGVGLVLGGEALVNLCARAGDPPPLILMLLLTGGRHPPLIIGYPMIHWLALMLLGWCWGRRLVKQRAAGQEPDGATRARALALAGVALLIAFVVVRALNGYGNMHLPRESQSLVQWLHVSKYPPGISYVTLELGLMCLILALLFRRGARQPELLMVLGQTPMFFYLLHFPLLVQSARRTGLEQHFGVASAYIGAAAVIAVLYPACRWYRRYKAAHPNGWPRYI
jgi:uncharacterized membrane protein